MDVFRIRKGAVEILSVDDLLQEAVRKKPLRKDMKVKKQMEANEELSIVMKETRRAKSPQKRLLSKYCDLRAKMVCERGQGTTEYAILVGVLVVIAIIAITVFRPKLEELWTAISDGISSL